MSLIMRAKDFIYRHLFGMKAKTLAGTEKNTWNGKGNKLAQMSTNLDHKEIEKEKNAQEYERI